MFKVTLQPRDEVKIKLFLCKSKSCALCYSLVKKIHSFCNKLIVYTKK